MWLLHMLGVTVTHQFLQCVCACVCLFFFLNYCYHQYYSVPSYVCLQKFILKGKKLNIFGQGL